MPLTKIQSLGITDGTIVNADINASAAIAGTKLSGAGKVLQVVTATDSTQRSTSSTSFVTASNTLSVTITPSSASNKIFIISTMTVYGRGSFTIFRDSTNLEATSNAGFATNEDNFTNECSMSVLDSPSTTSATTYQVYLRYVNDVTYINTGSRKSSITAFEIAG
jgi:hypothetical protein